MGRLTPAALVAILVSGCGRPPLGEGLDDALAKSLEACDALDGDMRDWCAIQTMELTGDLSSAAVFQVCERLDTDQARSWCIDLAARRGGDPLPDGACDSIKGDAVLRDSCWLSMSDAVLTASDSMEEVAAACRQTGELLSYCLHHVPLRRMDRYRAGGLAVLNDEMAQLAALIPECGEVDGLGFAIARIALYVGYVPGGDSPCDALPMGRAAERCRSDIDGILRGVIPLQLNQGPDQPEATGENAPAQKKGEPKGPPPDGDGRPTGEPKGPPPDGDGRPTGEPKGPPLDEDGRPIGAVPPPPGESGKPGERGSRTGSSPSTSDPADKGHAKPFRSEMGTTRRKKDQPEPGTSPSGEAP